MGGRGWLNLKKWGKTADNALTLLLWSLGALLKPGSSCSRILDLQWPSGAIQGSAITVEDMGVTLGLAAIDTGSCFGEVDSGSHSGLGCSCSICWELLGAQPQRHWVWRATWGPATIAVHVGSLELRKASRHPCSKALRWVVGPESTGSEIGGSKRWDSSPWVCFFGGGGGRFCFISK